MDQKKDRIDRQARTRAHDTAPVGKASSKASRPLPLLLKTFWIASLTMFGLMVLLGYVEFRMGFPPTHYNPLSGSRFDDLLEYIPTFRLLHTAAFFHNPATSPVAYPPFSAVLYGLVYKTGHPVALYLAVATAWLAFGIWEMRRILLQYSIQSWTAFSFPLTLALVSFPIAGLLQRGNIELFLWMFAAGGTWLFLRNHDDAAAILWAFAAAMKLYPVIFLVLLLPKRRYRAFAVGVVAFVAVSVVSMKSLGPDISVAFHGSLRNVFGYQGVRAGEWSLHELAANHSVFNLVKLAASISGHSSGQLTLPYYAAGAAVFAFAFFGRLARMPVPNQLLGTTAFMLMLPPVSYFYTLVHLYAPLLLLIVLTVELDRAGLRVRGLRRTMLLFVPLLASFMLFTFPKVLLFGGLVQASFLIALFVAALSFPFSTATGTADASV